MKERAAQRNRKLARHGRDIGGLSAMAMPRGSGKASLCETARLWTILFGHPEFVALIGRVEVHA